MSDAAPHRRSGLVVPVPEAEALVAAWRLAHDPSAPNGAPAHITVLFPFRPADAVDATLDELADLFASVPRQPYELAHLGVFPRVTWLAPEPASAFRDLTHHLVERFPDCQPYGGVFQRVTPHLTVLDHSAGTRPAAETQDAHTAIVTDLDPMLPLAAELTQVILLVEDDAGRWSTHATFPLG